MVQLHELSAERGARKKPTRKGRGIGSGLGKTAGRGHGGQKSRSGGGVRLGFEGGQMPLQRRLPKRGFTNIFKKELVTVNVEELNRFEDDAIVNAETLKAAGMIKSVKDGLKILGKGEISKRLVVQAHALSKTAVKKIEMAGGKVEVI